MSGEHEGTIRFRRWIGETRPEVEWLNGSRHRFARGWRIDATEFPPSSPRRAYDGEWALVPVPPLPCLTWIASGDVVFDDPQPARLAGEPT